MPLMFRVENIRHRYRRDAPLALDGVSLHIRRGSIHGLLGPNGAGKTTLISLLAGLCAVQEGRIDVEGMPLADWRNKHPTTLALVPQDYAFYPMLTVAENLEFFSGAQGLKGLARKENCARALAFASLENVARQRADTLSGGLRRRLNLAIGLTGAPDILLLDEPTVGVDPQSRAFLLEAVRQFAADGHTVLYTSHYMEEVDAVCAEVSIVDCGKVIATGPLDEVKRGKTLEQVFMELTHRSLRD